jgi:hypothetical protein
VGGMFASNRLPVTTALFSFIELKVRASGSRG